MHAAFLLHMPEYTRPGRVVTCILGVGGVDKYRVSCIMGIGRNHKHTLFMTVCMVFCLLDQA